MNVVKDWYTRFISDPQVVILVLILVIAFTLILTVGHWLAPVLTAVVISYLLLGPINILNRLGIPNGISLGVVFLLFLTLMVFVIFLVFPLFEQIRDFFGIQLPEAIGKFKLELVAYLEGVEKRFPGTNAKQNISIAIDGLNTRMREFGESIVKPEYIIGLAKPLFSIIVFIFIMPLLVFFFLKDKDKIIVWLKSYYPRDMELTNTVWKELNEQIANYIRGKVLEIVLVWVVTYVAFLLLGVKYPLVLSAMVGFSVLIPYIGAAIVTIPVVLIAYLYSANFWAVMLVYSLIMIVDGVVIVPLLFSEAVKLHPVAIVVSILVFGGLWGFWGVFFAIPLASLVQAIMRAWPRAKFSPKESPTASEPPAQ